MHREDGGGGRVTGSRPEPPPHTAPAAHVPSEHSEVSSEHSEVIKTLCVQFITFPTRNTIEDLIKQLRFRFFECKPIQQEVSNDVATSSCPLHQPRAGVTSMVARLPPGSARKEFWLLFDSTTMLVSLFFLLVKMRQTLLTSVLAFLIGGRFDMCNVMLTHHAGHNNFNKFTTWYVWAILPLTCFFSNNCAFFFYNLQLHKKHHRCNRALPASSVVSEKMLRDVYLCPNTDSDAIFGHRLFFHDLVLLHSDCKANYIYFCKVLLLFFFFGPVLYIAVLRSVLNGIVFVSYRRRHLSFRGFVAMIFAHIFPVETFKANSHIYPLQYADAERVFSPDRIRFSVDTKRSSTFNDSVDTVASQSIHLSPSFHECYHKHHHQFPSCPSYDLREHYTIIHQQNENVYSEYSNLQAHLGT